MGLVCLHRLQVRGHSTAPSAEPPSHRRETCFATSNCTPGRSLSNAPCAATPAVDVTLWAATCAPILVPASHTHAQSLTCEADIHWYCLHLCPFKPACMRSAEPGGGFSRNPIACTVIHITNDMLLIHVWKRTNHCQLLWFTCRHAAYSHKHVISFDRNHALKNIIAVEPFGCYQMNVSRVHVQL